jgi:hypothetical protein
MMAVGSDGILNVTCHLVASFFLIYPSGTLMLKAKRNRILKVAYNLAKKIPI